MSFWRDQRVVVTGGTGFVGRRLVNRAQTDFDDGLRRTVEWYFTTRPGLRDVPASAAAQ